MIDGVKDYLDVGHAEGHDVQLWKLKDDDIHLSHHFKGEGEEVEGGGSYTHAHFGNGDVSGRVDHTIKAISVGTRPEDEQCQYAVRLLGIDFPGYQIYYF